MKAFSRWFGMLAIIASCAIVLAIATPALAQNQPSSSDQQIQQTMPEPQAAPQTTTSGQYPNVAHLKPFSLEANYMSLPGYMRFLVYQRDGVWLSRAEAVAIVDRQIATGE